MKKGNLAEKVNAKSKSARSQNLADFVKSNLHYLSQEDQELFQYLQDFRRIVKKASPRQKYAEKSNYQTGFYNGKS